MANTIATGQTVGEIAAKNPAAASVFEKYGIDFCCGGKMPLEEACRTRGASPEEVARAIETATSDRPAAQDWTAAPLSALIDHIVSTHHAYLVEELPAIGNRARKVVEAHSERFPFVSQVADVFESLADELSSHLQKEEMVLFPYIKNLENAQLGTRPASCFGTIRNPIRMMEHEHDSAGSALAELRKLTADYSVPEGVCNTFRALYFGLERLERDLHTHIHLENNILFPRAAAMESKVQAAQA